MIIIILSPGEDDRFNDLNIQSLAVGKYYVQSQGIRSS